MAVSKESGIDKNLVPTSITDHDLFNPVVTSAGSITKVQLQDILGRPKKDIGGEELVREDQE